MSVSYQIHPAATIFPMMADDALRALADDIKTNGQHEPIELYDDQILDGRNRLAACVVAEVEPEFRVVMDLESPTAYVLSKNLHRRHLLTGQLGMIGDGARIQFEAEARARQITLAGTRPNTSESTDLGANLRQGLCDDEPSETIDIPPEPVDTRPEPGPAPHTRQREKSASKSKKQSRAPKSSQRAAKTVGVSSRTIEMAAMVKARAPELADRVAAGTMTLNQAVQEIKRRDRDAARSALPPPPAISERIEVANVAEHIPLADGSVDLIVTSPPYGLDVPYHGGDIDATTWHDFMADWLLQAYRVAKMNGGRLALNVPLDTSEPTYRPVYAETVQVAINIGWTYRGTIVWDEGNSTKGNRGLGSVDSASAPHPIAQVEMVALFSRGTWKKSEPGASDISHDEWQELGNGMWKFSGESRGWEGHPAPFPVELPRRLIQYLSYIGDTVLDPFCGSGTTVLVAKQLKREGIGFDISPEYVASAQRRVGAAS